MAQTPNLLITEIAANQNQKEVTANNAFVELDGALTNLAAIAMPYADYTLSATEGGQALGNMAFSFTGSLSGARNIIVPTNQKLYAVQNNTTGGFSLTVKTAGGSGVAVAVSATLYSLLYCDGTNVVAVGGAGGGSNYLAGLLDVLITSPTDGQSLVYNGGAEKWENGSAGGGSAALTPGPTAGFHGWSGRGGGTPGDQLFGAFFDSAGYTVANAGASGTMPPSVNIQCNAGGGLSAEVGEYSHVGVITPSFFLASQALVKLQQTALSRLWVGIVSAGGATLQTDTPGTAGMYVAAFRYSTNASDTNFKCVTADGASQTVTDSGVAADTNPHQFTIIQSGSSYKFYIDGTLVATNTTHLPTGTLALADIVQYDAPGGSSYPGANIAYMYWWSKT
jgi:hypothetical protein